MITSLLIFVMIICFAIGLIFTGWVIAFMDESHKKELTKGIPISDLEVKHPFIYWVTMEFSKKMSYIRHNKKT
ncbi:MAG: hypothetical protein Q4B57_02200 [Eubacteriales bacterium]|nr:hypothetical protein [Eubacteriales bacterium]